MHFFLSGLGNSSVNLPLITEAIIEADRLSFDGAVMPDHYMWGRREWSRSPNNNVTLETWTTLTYLAAKTHQIRLGTLVTPIPFRPPGMLAKMVSTLDILSNGRVILGVGAGWSKEEFEAYSEWNEPKVRVDKTIEGLELITRLWTQEEVTFDGVHYQAKAAVLEPKPIQKPYPQLLFGSSGDRMLRLTGKYGNICYLSLRIKNPKDSEKRREKVLRAAKKANRIDKISFMTGDLGSNTSYDQKEQIRKVEAAKEFGANYFLVSFPRNKMFLDSIRKFAKEVIPSF